MSEIILIETSTRLCSVALASDGRIRAYRESAEPHSHASLTSVFVKQVLDETGLKVSDCAAVCVSEGPGSYTGLRVGSSTAKGLCFASGVPLLSVGTLDTLVAQAQEDALSEGFDLKAIVPRCVNAMLYYRDTFYRAYSQTPSGQEEVKKAQEAQGEQQA